jgi:hypothetical protein
MKEKLGEDDLRITKEKKEGDKESGVAFPPSWFPLTMSGHMTCLSAETVLNL